MSQDYRNQFQLVGPISTVSIKPRVASTKYVKYVNLQQLPLLDSPRLATVFDLQPEEIPPKTYLTTSQWLVILSAGFIMCYFYKLQMN